MDLSVVIVNWNSVQHLRACLAALRLHTQGVRHEVIVIDNASRDGCGEMLAKEHPGVIFIQGESNAGFAAANNAAFKKTSGSLVLFLNPDTEVRGDAVARLVGAAKALPDAGVVGCRLLNSDLTVQTSCVQPFPTIVNQMLDSEFLHRLMPQSKLWGIGVLFREEKEPVPVEAVSGACLLIRRELFGTLGGFETNYFMYGEDIDLCYRVTRTGLRCYHIPQAVVVHHGGGSTASTKSGFSEVMMRESVHRFMSLNYGALRAAGYRLGMCVSAVLRLLAGVIAFPFRPQRAAATLNKWQLILRWSLGLKAVS